MLLDCFHYFAFAKYSTESLQDLTAISPKTLLLPAAIHWSNPRNAGRQMPVAATIGHSDEVLDRLIAELDTPAILPLVKIGLESFERIAEQAMCTPWVSHNPRRIDGPAHVPEILQLVA